MLAWKRLCTTLKQRNLVSGVQAVSIVMNLCRITSAKIASGRAALEKLGTEQGEILWRRNTPCCAKMCMGKSLTCAP